MNKVGWVLFILVFVIVNLVITDIKFNKLSKRLRAVEVDLDATNIVINKEHKRLNELQNYTCGLQKENNELYFVQKDIIKNQKKFNEWTVAFSKWTVNTFKYLGVEFDE